MKAAIIVLIAILSGCANAPTNNQLSYPERHYFNLGASSAVELGPCRLTVNGGHLLVRTDLDNSRTVEELDLALGDCPVAAGRLTNITMRLGQQAIEVTNFETSLIIYADLKIGATTIVAYFPEVRAPLSLSQDGDAVTLAYKGRIGADVPLQGVSIHAIGDL